MSRIFGTDGVSGIANTELTAELAYKLRKIRSICTNRRNSQT